MRIELAIRENSGLIAERILDPGEAEETETRRLEAASGAATPTARQGENGKLEDELPSAPPGWPRRISSFAACDGWQIP